MLGIDMKGLALPFAYITVLVGTFMTFSTVYRKRKAAQSANLAPWFPPHLQRNIYMSLLDMEPAAGEEKKPKVPDSVVRAALLRRAVEDVRRIYQVRTAKQACSSLLQRGSIGDDLWQRFQRVEKEMEEELRDVVMEANTLAPNWGQSIFGTANEIYLNNSLRKKLDDIVAQTDAEKAWWEKRRATIQSELLSELDADALAPEKQQALSSRASSVAGDTVLVDASAPTTPATPATPASGKKKKGKK